MGETEFIDRYSATGTPYPDPATMCNNCEGMGCYPFRPDPEEVSNDDARWVDAHNAGDEHEDGECDGWHFLSCLACGGTRKRQ